MFRSSHPLADKTNNEHTAPANTYRIFFKVLRRSLYVSSNWFSECDHPFIEKAMVISEPTVPGARLSGLG